MAAAAYGVCFGVTSGDPATDPSATEPDSAWPLADANNDDHVPPRSSSIADEAHSADTTVTYNVTSESRVVSDGADDDGDDDDAARIIDCRGAQNVAGTCTWCDGTQFSGIAHPAVVS